VVQSISLRALDCFPRSVGWSSAQSADYAPARPGSSALDPNGTLLAGPLWNPPRPEVREWRAPAARGPGATVGVPAPESKQPRRATDVDPRIERVRPGVDKLAAAGSAASPRRPVVMFHVKHPLTAERCRCRASSPFGTEDPAT
jgi:hypothetical protein